MRSSLRITIILAFLLWVAVAPASASFRLIYPGNQVFIGEEHLDVKHAVDAPGEVATVKIGWWASAAALAACTPPDQYPPDYVVDFTTSPNPFDINSFYIDPAVFGTRTGSWYHLNPTDQMCPHGIAFNVVDPILDVKIYEPPSESNPNGIERTGQAVLSGTHLTFRTATNMYTAANRADVDPATDGYITILVKGPEGMTYQQLYQTDTDQKSLTNQLVYPGPGWWGGNSVNYWDTGHGGICTGTYPAGTYVVQAVSTLNNMRQNYRYGNADYTGKTISEPRTVTIYCPPSSELPVSSCPCLNPETSVNFHADTRHTGVFDNGGTHPNNILKWKFPTGGVVNSSPTVADGVVYVGSADDYVYAIYEDTGIEKWRFPTLGDVDSTPAVYNKTVYVGSMDNNVYAIDADTHFQKWVFPTGSSVYSSPTVSNCTVFFGSLDKNIYAVNADTGIELWHYPTGQQIYSSPAVVNGTVYIGSNDNYVYAIDACTGDLKWKTWVGDTNSYQQGIRSSPAVVNNIVYIASDRNDLCAYDAFTGQLLRVRHLPSYRTFSSPAVVNNVVYIGTVGSSGYGDASTMAINALTFSNTNTNNIWSQSPPGSSAIVSSPAVADGRVYVGGDNFLLNTYDALSGDSVWTYSGGPTASSPAVAHGVAFIGSSDTFVYAIGNTTPDTGCHPECPLVQQTMTIVSDTQTTWQSGPNWPQVVQAQYPYSPANPWGGLAMPEAQWIWPYGTVDTFNKHGPFALRRLFAIPDCAQDITAKINITADNKFNLTFNGLYVGEDDVWQSTHLYNLAAHPGVNTIAVNVSNDYSQINVNSNPAGLLYRLDIAYHEHVCGGITTPTTGMPSPAYTSGPGNIVTPVLTGTSGLTQTVPGTPHTPLTVLPVIFGGAVAGIFWIRRRDR